MLKATLSRWLSSKFKKSFILPFIRYHSHFRPLRGTEELHPGPLTNIWAAEENIFVSTNLDRDFFRYLWYCGKKPNRMWLSVLCTLIDNEYASSQWSKFVVYSLGCNLVPRRSLRCLPLSCFPEEVRPCLTKCWKYNSSIRQPYGQFFCFHFLCRSNKGRQWRKSLGTRLTRLWWRVCVLVVDKSTDHAEPHSNC